MKADTTKDPRTPLPDSGEFITLAEASERTKKFREDYVVHIYDKHEKIKANFFSKENVMKVLGQPGCKGIRVYNAVHPKAEQDPTTKEWIDRREILIVGTDKDGNDILKKSDYEVVKGCSPLSVFMAVPASSGANEDALLLGNPWPCPKMCGKGNELNGNPQQ